MRQFCVAALLAVWAGMAWAGMSGGLAAYRAGDYAGALRLWRAAASAGDAAAQKGLGDLYVAGKGVAPDAEEGMSYGMPALKLEGHGIAGFAAFKRHLSFFPMSGTVLQTMAATI